MDRVRRSRERIVLCGIATYDDALQSVTQQMGPPSEIGYVIHANVAETLHRRAMNAEFWRQLLGHERRAYALTVTP